jgi:amino acid adenylation domain-containing protein
MQAEELTRRISDSSAVVLPLPRVRGRTGGARARARLTLAMGELRAAAARMNVHVDALLLAALDIVLFRYSHADEVDLSMYGRDDVRRVYCRFEDERAARDVVCEINACIDAADASPDLLEVSIPAQHEGDAIEMRARFSLDDQLTVLLEAGTTIDPGTLERMAGHLDTVLGAIVGKPDAAIADLPLLTAEERHSMLEWNSTQAPYRTDATVQRLFEEAAARFADSTALIAGEKSLTYAELNRRANRLARRLIARGIGPESRVGILLHRKTPLIVSVLAVLKAGAGYVPLDASNPPARLELILKDADIDLVLTQSSLRSMLGESTVATIDVVAEDDHAFPADNPTPRGTPDNVAYVIYTSGSTGKPKGVVIEHRSVAAFLAWTRHAFSDRELSGVLLASSLAFDVSVFELFAPLCHGGCVILVDDLLGFPDAPARDRVRLVSGTAAGLGALANTTTFPASVTTVIQAGELMHGTLAAALYEQPGVERVVNLCGATEDTVYSVSYEVPRGNTENPPIGKPFENHEAYVLDVRMQPLPAGIPGELYYAGLGLAREYFKRPELTRERFIPNPFPHSPYKRLYRSGDIVRSRPDGNLEYISRADDQLKIRGFRVEIAEIEAQLATHPSIVEVAVAARKTPVGETALVAYVVPRAAGVLSIGALRQYAAERLPDYMLPAALVVLRTLPRSATGKIDRRALPEPQFERGAADAAPQPSDDDVETTLLRLWREMLGIEKIGLDDNFFELGGHSLVAVRVLAWIREKYGVAIGLREFFSTPCIRDLARKIDVPANTGQPASILRREVVPSFSQEQLWFIDRLLPRHDVYNVPVKLRLRGRLDEIALVRALDVLVARHEQLRATFPDRDGMPFVQIISDRTMRLQRAEAHGAEADRLADQAMREPFDLQAGPLVRALLIKVAEDEHLLVVTMHHIVCDGWSIGVMYEELAALYAAFTEGREPELRVLSTTYAEYAAGERAAAAENRFAGNLAYWSERLAGAPRVELPGDRAATLSGTFGGDHVGFRIAGATLEALREFARATGATPSVVLLATYAALIGRYTLEEQVVIGMPTAGRPSSELDQLVGYFVGMAPLRIDTGTQVTYRELVGLTKDVMLDGLDHQPVPIQLIVERVAPQRLGLKNPLFSFAFVSQTALDPAASAGLRIEMLHAATGTSKFDVLLDVTEGRDEIVCLFEYATDLYDRARLEGLARSFTMLLERGVHEPEGRVSQIPLLDDVQKDHLRRPPEPADRSRAEEPVYRHFEQRACERPDAVALVYGDEEMTYRQLDSMASRLASHLQALGAAPGTFVGICAQRSPLVVGAILGVLKSGAAYVPLDPLYPAQRLSFIAHDAGLKIVLADRSSRNFVTENGAKLFVLEDLVHEEAQPVELPAPGPDDPAYIIYTSGSTGTPKGVVVTHRNVARLFSAAESVYDFGRDDVWTLFHSYAFDFSVWEIWGALLYGGKLVVVPAEIARNPNDFCRLLQSQGVTVLNQTPSAFYALIAVDRIRTESLTSLRYVIFAGEGLDVRALEPWFVRYGDEMPALVNMYGITETTVHVTHRRIRRADASRPFGPIGIPLDDLQIYLLDRERALVPDGAIGEIYVAGEGVARGYLNRDDLTRERFVPNPVGPGPSVYRSGDLARRLLDDGYEYVGRNDDQIKIRGFRVELGEIEAALATHPMVDRAAVIIDCEGEENGLAAYVVLRQGGTEMPGDLRTHLAAQLPQHMIPATFYSIREIPLTENGKLDRRALAGAAESLRSAAVASEPMAPIERRLARLFSDALGIERVGVDENFFFVGGHSLLAARLVSTVEAEFPDEVARLRQGDGRSPLLGAFYVDPTVRGLAATLLRARKLDEGRIVPLRAGAADHTPLFWFHGMFNGDGLYTWNLIEALERDRPVWVVHPHGYDNAPFEADIKALASEQLDLIRSVRPQGPYHIGGFCNGALIAFEVASSLAAAGEKIESLFLVSPPPMVPAYERLLALSDFVARLLRIRGRGRVIMHSYVYRYAQRLNLFVRAGGSERLQRLRHGSALALKKLLRIGRRIAASSARDHGPASFSSPAFKNDWYLQAIAEYVPARYAGAMHVVWGQQTLRQLSDASGGWSQLGTSVAVDYVDGGHFCVVDNPEAVSALLKSAIEVDRAARR